MIHLTGTFLPPLSLIPYISFRLGFYPVTLFIWMCRFLPPCRIKGTGILRRPRSLWQIPQCPLPFSSIIWPPGLSSRMTLKPRYWFSCHLRSYLPTLHFPLSGGLKNQIWWGRGNCPRDFRGCAERVAFLGGWVWSAWKEVIRMPLYTLFWEELVCSFVGGWWLFQPWTPSSYEKRK